MLIQETWVSKTEGYISGENEPYEPYTDNIGELFRFLQQEYGRCTSKVYIDTEQGTRAIGWVFEKRQGYLDCKETYLMETWVMLHEQKPTRTIEYHYRYLN